MKPPAGVVPLSVEFSLDAHRFVIRAIDTRSAQRVIISGTFDEPLHYVTEPATVRQTSLAQLIEAALALAPQEDA